METVFPGVQLWTDSLPPRDRAYTWTVFCCLSGQLTYGSSRLYPGTVVLEPPGFRERALSPQEGASCAAVQFSMPEAERTVQIHSQQLLGQSLSLTALLNRCCGTAPLVLWDGAPLYGIFAAFSQAQGECRPGLIRLKVLELVLTLQSQETASAGTHPSEQTAQMEAVRAYLLEHFSERIRVETLAHRFHTSQTVLKRSFRETFGEPIGGYMRRQRLEAACRLLTETEDSIAEIVRAVGYENAGRFSVTFRQTVGLTPSAYRKYAKTAKLQQKLTDSHSTSEKECVILAENQKAGFPAKNFS